MINLKNNIDFLKLLSSADKKLRKYLIRNATKNQIFSVCEVILNLLKGNIELSPEELKSLSKKKSVLRKLINKSSLKEKKYLIQRGGFLNILIPAILSGLSVLASNIL